MGKMSLSLPFGMGKAIEPMGHVDALAGGRVTGWALAPGGAKVEAWLDGNCVASCRTSMRRQDVATAYPGKDGAITSGFSLQLPNAASQAGLEGHLVIRACSAAFPIRSRIIGNFTLVGDALVGKVAEAGESGIEGPFPREVINAVAAVWPEDCAALETLAGQERFAERLRRMMATPNLNALPALADYARYLTLTRAHCAFVERYFPTNNARSTPGATDYHCKPNSIREIYAIIHQLYVLKSWGVEGDFAEFGCFKGYSSAMLSFACRLLDVKMHIFDSFEGLPPSEGSGYRAGEYAGSLDEVRENVTRFGAIEAVEFHQGFFADTFRDWRPPPLMCLWMDVDLEVSARDLMVVADQLDPRASLFSHECSSDIFRDGEIVNMPRPDNPVPPMLDRHAELHRPLTGRYVSGYTGSFWPREGGIPVVDNDVLMKVSSFV